VVTIKLKRRNKKRVVKKEEGWVVWRVLSLHIGDGKRDPSEAEGRSFLCFILPGLLNAMIAHGSGHQKKRRKNSNVALFFKPPKKRTKRKRRQQKWAWCAGGTVVCRDNKPQTNSFMTPFFLATDKKGQKGPGKWPSKTQTRKQQSQPNIINNNNIHISLLLFPPAPPGQSKTKTNIYKRNGNPLA